MARSRLELDRILRNILGSNNVYFQPPASVKMKYDAIVYELDDISARHADNIPYLTNRRYRVTLITKNPDNNLSDEIAMLPLTQFNRFYTADNLNHYVYIMYY
jgi:IS30 family transposase